MTDRPTLSIHVLQGEECIVTWQIFCQTVTLLLKYLTPYPGILQWAIVSDEAHQSVKPIAQSLFVTLQSL